MISREKLRNDLIYCKGLRRKSLEAVIEVINKQPQIEKCADCSRRKWYTKGYKDGLNADKWIPCEERLPKEEYGTYWIAVEQEPDEPYYYCSAVWTSEHGFRTMDIDAQGNIIAWKPIQPYKKEGAENE